MERRDRDSVGVLGGRLAERLRHTDRARRHTERERYGRRKGRKKKAGPGPDTFTAFHRVPLKKMKSIRETMKEQGVLKDFLKNHKYDPGQKYHFGKFGDYSVLYEPMAYMDVSLNTLLPTQGVSVPAAKRSSACLPALGCTHPFPNLLWATVGEPELGGGGVAFS